LRWLPVDGTPLCGPVFNGAGRVFGVVLRANWPHARMFLSPLMQRHDGTRSYRKKWNVRRSNLKQNSKSRAQDSNPT
jgi:hypothetical protein